MACAYGLGLTDRLKSETWYVNGNYLAQSFKMIAEIM